MEQLKLDNTLTNRYQLSEKLYSDGTVTVFSANEVIDFQKRIARRVALKIVQIDPKDTLKILRLDVYYNYLQATTNGHVLRIYNHFFTNKNSPLELWIVSEYCGFGNLENYWASNTVAQEDQNIFFISDIAVGLEYIYKTLRHQHLNLCPNNLLLSRDPASVFPKVKIANFALCDAIQTKTALVPGFEATMFDVTYSPPEYLSGFTHSKSDVWSFGILIFKLLVGCTPFETIQMDPLTAMAVQANLSLAVYIQNESAIDLLEKMLVYEPDKRISMNDVLNHKFIHDCVQHKYGTRGSRENYKAVKLLDEGNYGRVLLAQTSANEYVAIKEISNKIDSLQREATCMRLCKHPNLVEYKDFFGWDYSMVSELVGMAKVKGNYLYLVMEFCDSGNLEKYMKQKNAPLSDDEIKYFLGEIGSGLWYLHFIKKLIHRDLKPANLLLQSTDTQGRYKVKIADYGFSRGINEFMVSNVGTPIYEAPEIIKRKPYTAKSDLYSLGVILFQMATTYFPFSDDPQIFQVAMRNETPVQIPDGFGINPLLADLISKLITHHEELRLSWQQFYEHPYVLEAMKTSEQTEKQMVEEDFKEF
ncbi:serine/threonine protein kinase SAPK9, putative [Entamoeba invadens IP1]|uniref:serine/threonine protein kinase SAPK9, putative n=1 Tax=Entamoeba invadens IP1 TaxID=370355 RepID=UPI0002C3EB6D|nr:serine/threonine protein kinase SAPK9, putative [Entamoeba invadens IP1]ELP93236.1 serine/threonine protein kinase SAPK9, putative [Entamoeba invadens IP1]|eukprot:XP_004260007.1 serine/threonine protein kinase SAPK9, putative [Entamoeba invadens IP1]